MNSADDEKAEIATIGNDRTDRPEFTPTEMYMNCRNLLFVGIVFSLFQLLQSGAAAQSTQTQKATVPTEKKDSRTAGSDSVPPYECRYTNEVIKIDGKDNEAAWKTAQPVNEFTISWDRNPKKKPPTATRAKLLWNQNYLYFFADMDDSDLFANVTEHDGVTWNNDVFEMFLKPAEDKPGYYEFQVNAANTKLDMYFPRRGAGGYDRFKSDGTFEFNSAVVLKGTLNKWEDQDQGWSVEGQLSWKDFARTGGAPKAGDTWKFGLFRYDYSVAFEGPALSTSAPLKNGSFHRHEDYAPIRFVGP